MGPCSNVLSIFTSVVVPHVSGRDLGTVLDWSSHLQYYHALSRFDHWDGLPNSPPHRKRVRTLIIFKNSGDRVTLCDDCVYRDNDITDEQSQ